MNKILTKNLTTRRMKDRKMYDPDLKPHSTTLDEAWRIVFSLGMTSQLNGPIKHRSMTKKVQNYSQISINLLMQVTQDKRF